MHEAKFCIELGRRPGTSFAAMTMRARATAGVVLVAALGGCSLFAPPEASHPGTVVERPRTPLPPAPATTGSAAVATAAAPPAPSAPPATELAQPSAPLPAVSTRHYQLGPATSALVGQAHAAGARGDYLTAMSTLERAAHIEPRNPLVWIEIAKVRLASGQPEQAESVARKAVALSEGDQRTLSEGWKQVALALKAQNKNPEAAAAEARANRPFVDVDGDQAKAPALDH